MAVPLQRAGQAAHGLSDFARGPRTSYLDHARNPDVADTTYPFRGGFLISSALPDTLYAWMRPDRLSSFFDEPRFARAINDRDHFARALWRTPAGSFGYGGVSVRAKLRDDVNFVELSDESRVIQDLENVASIYHSVFVRAIPGYGFHEYLVASPYVFHSMSTGTPEHAAEIASEAGVIANAASRKDYDFVFGVDGNLGANPPVRGEQVTPEKLARGFEWDAADWSHQLLEQRVDLAQAVSDTGSELIQFHPDVDPNRAEHFATQVEPYWEIPTAPASGPTESTNSLDEHQRIIWDTALNASQGDEQAARALLRE